MFQLPGFYSEEATVTALNPKPPAAPPLGGLGNAVSRDRSCSVAVYKSYSYSNHSHVAYQVGSYILLLWS